MDLSADDIIRTLAQQVADLSVQVAVRTAERDTLAKKLADCPCEGCPIKGE